MITRQTVTKKEFSLSLVKFFNVKLKKSTSIITFGVLERVYFTKKVLITEKNRFFIYNH